MVTVEGGIESTENSQERVFPVAELHSPPVWELPGAKSSRVSGPGKHDKI